MGQFLAIGLRLSVVIRRKDIAKYLDRTSLDNIFKQIEKKYHLSDIYDRKEDGEYYVYNLKTELLDKELISFIEKFYALRYPKDSEVDSINAINLLKELPDTASRLALLEKRMFQAYQEGSQVDYFYIDKFTSKEIPVYSNNMILSSDGKICMECYEDLFNFFCRCIQAQVSEFTLSKSLIVWLND